MDILVLNKLRVGLKTTSAVRLFQDCTTLWVKNLLRISVLGRIVGSLKGWPRVWVMLDNVKKFDNVGILLLKIFQTRIRSALCKRPHIEKSESLLSLV